MGFMGGGYFGPKEISYLFIDGGSLRSSIERFHREFYPNLPVPSVDHRRIGDGFTKVFYYDCPPPKCANESDESFETRVMQYQEATSQLRSLPGWHVFEGVTKRQGKKATQKEVDVLITVDMLTHAYRRNMHRVSFLTGDQDFRPLFEALVRDGMFVELWYDPMSASRDLIDAADSRRALTPFAFFSFLNATFQRAHPMPAVVGVPERLPTAAALIQRGKIGDNNAVELAVKGNEFIIAYPDAINEGRFMNMTHTDRAFLEFVFDKVVGPVEWHNV